MDLVDIDKVLDNLELNEEEQKEEIPIIKQRQSQILSVSSLNESDHSTNYGYGASATLNLNSATTGDRVNRFVGVSQVFSSLDDYRKNVESLEAGLDLYTNRNKNNKTSDNNETYDNNTNTTNHSNNTEKDEQCAAVLIRGDEEADEEDPYPGGDEINKFVSTDEYGFSSNSITTSSSSTFSSGPSPALLSTESESSLNLNAKELAQSNLAKENDQDDSKITSNSAPAASDGNREGEANSDTNVSFISNQQTQQQQRSEFDDLAVGLSSISLTTTNQESILSSSDIASSKCNLKTDLDNLCSSSLSLPQTTKNNYLNSEEPKDFVEQNNGRHEHEQKNESMLNLENSESDILLKAEQPNSQQNNVMVTFSSTMDEISDTELDSILQEIDAEMTSHPFLGAETTANVNSAAAGGSEIDACSTEIKNNKVTKMDRNSGHSNQETKPLTASISPNNLSLGQKCDDGMNIDSFSQASTLEFTEDRPRAEVDDHHINSTSCKGLDHDDDNDENDDDNDDDDDVDDDNDDDDDNNGDDDDEIRDVVDSKEKKDNIQSDIQRRQRPTTLDLPVRKINLYATAGQTPPGSRIYDQSTSSSEEDTPEDKSDTAPKNNDEHVNFNNNDGAGHTPPERSDRAVFGATLSALAPAPVSAPEIANFDDPMIAAPSLESTQVEIKVPESVVSPSASGMTSTDGTTHNIGKVPPIWVPDQEASACMQCQHKFTILKRRHHCRACGQVLCSVCCSQKFKLEFLSNLESRVCVQCFLLLTKLQQQMDQQMSSSTAATTASSSSSPNPNNPMEYCSKIPPHRQVNPQAMSSYPTVIVPVGVLKKEGNATKSRKRKSVMFSDGIRPGSDLASLDQKWSDAKHARKSISSTNNLSSDNVECTTNTEGQSTKITRNNSSKSIVLMDDGNGCFIPPTGENTLPPIITLKKSEKVFQELANNGDLVKRLQTESLKFVLQTNFFVFVKISHLKCCINKTVINFTTCGLNNVGNDEIIILLELDNSNKIPKDIFVHLNEIYWEASRGHPITELGFSMPKHLHFLGSREHGGFLFIRSTFQCLLDVHVPTSPFLIGVLIHRWEVPWAKIFPLRLMLRLGAQYRYYPSPHISVREREPVYAEIAQTIINLLADFRNYTYTIPTIKGMYIHMEDRRTNILIPRNRLDDVIKAINNSSDHILAMGANFSKKADGHLVCIQNIKSESGDSHAYSTQAINIQGQPRKVTGASFFVLNEALKSTSGLSGKCSIIEDGLMVQILPSKMAEIRTALINMKDINIVCGPIEADEHQTEVVYIQWVDDDREINIGVRSPIDSKKMDGIPSIRVHSGVTLSNNNHILKWTEVFIIEVSGDNGTCKAAVDISKVSEQIAKNASVALLPFLDLLVANGSVKIGLRVTLNNDNVCYEAGSQNEKLPPLYMNALDNELIPTLHKQTNDIGKIIVLELIFHILNVHINV